MTSVVAPFPNSKRTPYVLGFAFDPELTYVALIRKTKPEWQAGKLNGIGGKVEPSETFRQAMVREFFEETGSRVPSERWHNFSRINGTTCIIPCYVCTTNLGILESPTEEKVIIYPVHRCHVGNPLILHNLPWLVALAHQHASNPTESVTSQVDFTPV